MGEGEEAEEGGGEGWNSPHRFKSLNDLLRPLLASDAILIAVRASPSTPALFPLLLITFSSSPLFNSPNPPYEIPGTAARDSDSSLTSPPSHLTPLPSLTPAHLSPTLDVFPSSPPLPLSLLPFTHQQCPPQTPSIPPPSTTPSSPSPVRSVVSTSLINLLKTGGGALGRLQRC